MLSNLLLITLELSLTLINKILFYKLNIILNFFIIFYINVNFCLKLQFLLKTFSFLIY